MLRVCSSPFRRRQSLRSLTMIVLSMSAIFVLITYIYANNSAKKRWTAMQAVEGGYLSGVLAAVWPSVSNHGSIDVSQTCVHPHMELWHADMKPYFRKPAPPLRCNQTETNWAYTVNGTFYVSPTAVQRHGGRIDCLQVPIRRGADDFQIVRAGEEEIKPIGSGDLLTTDVFEVKCVAADGKVWVAVLSGIAKLRNRRTALDDEVRNVADSNVSHLSDASSLGLELDVIIFGFDSVSRMTWMRNLPLSYAYFTEKLGAIVLEGYNIVGDGTPQALLPILTGKREEELPEARRGFEGARTVDGHPWIWKDFKRAGFVTQWGEDSPSFGTFTYRMLGFKGQPVDHYMRTFYMAAAARSKRTFTGSGDHLCLGSLPIHLNMMNYLRDFVDVYGPSQRKFSFLFHADYTHGGYTELRRADEDLKDLLVYLQEHGHLDNALLILMSDHGARFQNLRRTEQGKYEERMPFVGIRVPASFKSSHTIAVRNLRSNAARLTTPFDLHATLHDVINYNTVTSSTVEDKPYPRGLSLFRNIPQDRSCEDASIEPHWCACLSWRPVPVTDSQVRRSASAVIAAINRAMADERDLCQLLAIANITQAVRYVANDKMLRFKKSSDEHGRVPDFTDQMNFTEVVYQVTIWTMPGEGLFEATVRHALNNDHYLTDLKGISRINRYGSKPHCIQGRLPHLRPYCYCREQLPTSTVSTHSSTFLIESFPAAVADSVDGEEEMAVATTADGSVHLVH